MGILRKPHGNVVRAVGDIDLTNRRPANACLDQAGNVGYVNAVARCCCTVDVDSDLGNRRLLKYGRLRRALDAAQYAHDLSSDTAHFIEIVANNVDDQRAVRTTYRIVDHVDDRLTNADGGESRQMLQAHIEFLQKLRLGLA